MIDDLKTGVEKAIQVARHIYYAKACLLTGNTKGHDEHLQDALSILGAPTPEDVGLSRKVFKPVDMSGCALPTRRTHRS